MLPYHDFRRKEQNIHPPASTSWLLRQAFLSHSFWKPIIATLITPTTISHICFDLGFTTQHKLSPFGLVLFSAKTKISRYSYRVELSFLSLPSHNFSSIIHVDYFRRFREYSSNREFVIVNSPVSSNVSLIWFPKRLCNHYENDYFS